MSGLDTKELEEGTGQQTTPAPEADAGRGAQVPVEEVRREIDDLRLFPEGRSAEWE